MNISSGGGDMSMLNRTYGSGKKQISLLIMYHSSGKTGTQSPMGQLDMETSAGVMKTIRIQGFDALYQYFKNRNDALVSVYLEGKATVMLTTSGGGAKGEKHDVGLLGKINLKKIYASL